MDQWPLKALVTVGCMAVVLVRIYRPDIRMDGVNCTLLVLAILPWLSSLIKSFEMPGGWKIEFQDVSKAGAKVTGGTASQALQGTADATLADISEIDPNLALVALRIEIEKRVRALARHFELPEKRPLGALMQDLSKMNAAPPDVVAGLRDLVALGNNAAHGARVEPAAAHWAVTQGPAVLGALDAMLPQDL